MSNECTLSLDIAQIAEITFIVVSYNQSFYCGCISVDEAFGEGTGCDSKADAWCSCRLLVGGLYFGCVKVAQISELCICVSYVFCRSSNRRAILVEVLSILFFLVHFFAMDDLELVMCVSLCQYWKTCCFSFTISRIMHIVEWCWTH
ncbi:hypothetical protein KC19_1G215000 [Ceratodon purpureus]|uniref:Transmembrane protein n=1 Tax=Ceratodon purpureus TaxID=3225 RepID=A0A8T0JAJ1_CERPU|nr:hypothetical protein KC19_1G215000 [Ceratodon purpureus]